MRRGQPGSTSVGAVVVAATVLLLTVVAAGFFGASRASRPFERFEPTGVPGLFRPAPVLPGDDPPLTPFDGATCSVACCPGTGYTCSTGCVCRPPGGLGGVAQA